MLNHLIVEKVKSRRGSNLGSSQNSSGEHSVTIDSPKAIDFFVKLRTQSFNAEIALKHVHSLDYHKEP